MAVIGGVLVTILGIVVTIVVVRLRMQSGDPGVEPDAARDITLAIVALKLVICGPVFTSSVCSTCAAARCPASSSLPH